MLALPKGRLESELHRVGNPFCQRDLVVEDGELRAYGGGLLSSLAEATVAVTAPEARRLYLDIPRVMRTAYHFDRFQEVYFVVDSFQDLLRQTEETRFADVYQQIKELPDLVPSAQTCTDVPFPLIEAVG